MKKHFSGHYHDWIKKGDRTALLTMLSSPQPAENLNQVDVNGCSLLYLALSLGYGRHKPEIINMLLSRGAVIKNGKAGEPLKIAKLLTRHANAGNIKYIMHRMLGYRHGLKPADLFLEIGSGDGYLKYLLSLSKDQEMLRLIEKILETEPSPELVRDNGSHGRYLLQSGVKELDTFFQNDFFSAIISLNVLDLFPARELTEKLRLLHDLLKAGGLILHIMSSSVHPDVFRTIRDSYPDHIMLPYYRDGFVGVRLIEINQIQKVIQGGLIEPEQLAELFARQPERYIQIADEISRNFSGIKEQGKLLLLKDHSFEQLLTGFRQTGFKILDCDEITSETVVEQDQYHVLFPGFNQFSSIAGSLFTDVNKQIASARVLEKSVFFYIIAEKV